ncbi:hypothetical protein ACVMB2_003483 [Sinorhizobium meliloti]|nr:hypothetical protein [Sinorhizobium meliloti]
MLRALRSLQDRREAGDPLVGAFLDGLQPRDLSRRGSKSGLVRSSLLAIVYASFRTMPMLMNKPSSCRSMQLTGFWLASETAAAEVPDFHNRFPSRGNAVGVLWAAN